MSELSHARHLPAARNSYPGPDAAPPPPIDAWHPLRAGEYRDGVIVVRRRANGARLRLGATRTAHFDLVHDDDHDETLVIEHDYDAASLDDDLAGTLSAELFEPGWLRGQDLFERVFTGVVLTCASDPIAAWEAFYRNTIQAFDEAVGALHHARTTEPTTAIARYAPVHAHVREVVLGPSLLELGSCFGFMAIRLARNGFDVTASDISPGSMKLLDRVAPVVSPSLTTLVANAAHLPVPTDSYDSVLAIHLLEHLDVELADQVIAEAVRIARRRVVIAVPFEEEPTEQFGHLHPLTLADLQRWGVVSGRPFRAYEHHGGWLIIETAP